MYVCICVFVNDSDIRLQRRCCLSVKAKFVKNILELRDVLTADWKKFNLGLDRQQKNLFRFDDSNRMSMPRLIIFFRGVTFKFGSCDDDVTQRIRSTNNVRDSIVETWYYEL